MLEPQRMASNVVLFIFINCNYKNNDKNIEINGTFWATCLKLSKLMLSEVWVTSWWTWERAWVPNIEDQAASGKFEIEHFSQSFNDLHSTSEELGALCFSGFSSRASALISTASAPHSAVDKLQSEIIFRVQLILSVSFWGSFEFRVDFTPADNIRSRNFYKRTFSPSWSLFELVKLFCHQNTIDVLDIHSGLGLQQQRQQFCWARQSGVVQRRKTEGKKIYIKEGRGVINLLFSRWKLGAALEKNLGLTFNRYQHWYSWIMGQKCINMYICAAINFKTLHMDLFDVKIKPCSANKPGIPLRWYRDYNPEQESVRKHTAGAGVKHYLCVRRQTLGWFHTASGAHWSPSLHSVHQHSA